MAGKISPRDIEEVKARVNIADVVGSYVALKPASAGSLKGLCPFHQEKSPSFNVRPLQGFYHCFGCGAGGDVYKFLQEMESLSFYEAVENLAGKVGYTLTYEAGVIGASQPNPRVENYYLQTVYRKAIHEDWLVMELVPQLIMARDESWDPEPRFQFNLEVYFFDF